MKQLCLFLLLLLLAACSSNEEQPSLEEITNKEWSEIEETADGDEVRLYMWGGDEGINQYIDKWLTPQLKEAHNITLKRVPMDTPEILQKLQTEKQAGKQQGTIDLIWLNGENFKNAKKNDWLAGSFVDKLPIYNEYYDKEDPAISTDFGMATEGMEAPWGKVQFVFHYDEAKLAEPPQNFKELKQWIAENPGEFTYPQASDFTGNAFLRHLLYAKADSPADIYEQPLQQEQLSEPAESMWDYLKEIEPHLWRNGEHYPNSLSELDRLYSDGEVTMTMGYNEARAESLIDEGIFPETTKSFVLNPGSIGNTHFLSLPFNSPNKSAALVAVNYMLSPEAQLAKYKAEYWGENTPISFEKLNKEQKQAFAEVDRGSSVLHPQRLEESFLPESDAEYVEWMEDQWFNELVQN
ncbi:ABC transporter substrate-binding protein [Halobacillus sp. Marseille-Q1614]|uniref:ABC transporter substrate-binding protein n=1 Tax=Halobacillus sp. Marseille-Q1614 TaxID=2709134 RepID=UPI0015705056|nr:ABC transporter substrate-binding protein [Halobacillus sp. Marseille-Q1614]